MKYNKAQQKLIDNHLKILALSQIHGSVEKIAEIIDVTPSILRVYMKEHGIKKTGKKAVDPAIEQRKQAIIAYYLENHVLEETGVHFGVTREYVRQILCAAGIFNRANKRITVKPFTPRNKGLTTRQAFWQLVDKSGGDDACWIWQGKTLVSGYGDFHIFKGKERYAHRVSYLFTHGKSAPNCVLHSCDNPPCVNPAHLRNGTHAENVRDREERGRSAWQKDYETWRKKIIEGREHLTILDEEKAAEIKRRLKNGELQKDIAPDYGVSVHTISSISTGRAWKHVEI